MQLTALGPLQVSRVGLGCNNFGGRLDIDRTRRVVDAALDAGISFFDTADVYGDKGGSERQLGELLRGRRDRVVLATKFGHDMGDGLQGGGADYVPRALEASLSRLQTDHVDLLYYHRPDGHTPISETVGAMAQLVAAGKALAIGVSNVSLGELEEAAVTAEIAAVQNEYSLLHRDVERDVLPRCRELGIGFVPYFPLASGLLTGKYRPGAAAPGTRLASDAGLQEGARVTGGVNAEFARVEDLSSFAQRHGHSLLELAIAGLASQPGVASVIAGATSPDQVQANAAAAAWELTPDELAALATA
jgi:aryl-alcohol dehydrogenase-like predicted oxidoreductase